MISTKKKKGVAGGKKPDVKRGFHPFEKERGRIREPPLGEKKKELKLGEESSAPDR